MKKLNLLICAILLFSCTKNVHEQTKNEPPVATTLSNAFKFGLNLDPNAKRYASKSSGKDIVITDPVIIEERMLSNLTETYGQEINQKYYEDKKNCTPDFTKFESLENISLDGVDETNVNGFITKVFSSTKSKIKSTNSIYSAQSAMQKNATEFLDQVDICAQSLAMRCINEGALDENEVKNELLTTVRNFRDNVDLGGLSQSEKDNVLNSLATIENSLETFVEFSVVLPISAENKSSIFPLSAHASKSWFKNIVKNVVQCIVITVCLVGGTWGGAYLGSLICGNPACLVVGGAAGFVGGALLAHQINAWVDTW